MGSTDGCWHSSTGISPPRGSHAALPIACDALTLGLGNPGKTELRLAIREYHCRYLRCLRAALPSARWFLLSHKI